MNNDAPMSPIRELARAFAGMESTEELIIFVAGRDNMLAFCRQLIERFDRDPHDRMIREADAVCAAHGILPGALFLEIRKVLLALNKFHDAGRDHYAVLDLPAGASRMEVKNAYRRLSKKYHPDGTEGAADGGRRFMEIAGAYHALMLGFHREKDQQRLPWRKKSRRDSAHSPRRSRNVFFGLLLALVVVLTGISVFLSAGYNRKAVISQFQTNLPDRGRQEEPAVLPAEAGNAAYGEAPAAALAPVAEAEEEQAVKEFVQREEWAGPEADSLADAHGSAARDAVPVEDADAGGSNSAPADRDGSADPAVLASATPVEEQRQAARAEAAAAADQSPLPVAEHFVPPAPRDGLAVARSDDVAPDEQAVAVRGEEREAPGTGGELSAADRGRTREVVTETGEPARGQAAFSREEGGMTASTADTAVPAPAAQPPARDVAREINEFVNHYARRYNDRELVPFLALFADNATENGHSLAAMTEQYKSLFAHTQRIRLSVLNLDWSEKGEGFEARGDFEASYLYDDGRSRKHNGEITFHLIDDRGEIKIHSLDYVFLQ
jgi:curved DNA-binding protein CbpA